jgi:hypothetical protein
MIDALVVFIKKDGLVVEACHAKLSWLLNTLG